MMKLAIGKYPPIELVDTDISVVNRTKNAVHMEATVRYRSIPSPSKPADAYCVLLSGQRTGAIDMSDESTYIKEMVERAFESPGLSMEEAAEGIKEAVAALSSVGLLLGDKQSLTIGDLPKAEECSSETETLNAKAVDITAELSDFVTTGLLAPTRVLGADSDFEEIHEGIHYTEDEHNALVKQFNAMADDLAEAKRTIEQLTRSGDKMAESLDANSDMLEQDGADMQGQRQLTKEWRAAKGEPVNMPKPSDALPVKAIDQESFEVIVSWYSDGAAIMKLRQAMNAKTTIDIEGVGNCHVLSVNDWSYPDVKFTLQLA